MISIDTATYNSEQYIETCLASVNSQTDVHFEHIVVDGLSTDATLSKLQSGSYPNLKIITEQDSGIYSALNKGIRTASGEIIGFVHSDDKLASNLTLKTIQNAFKEQKCDVLYADLDFFDFLMYFELRWDTRRRHFGHQGALLSRTDFEEILGAKMMDFWDLPQTRETSTVVRDGLAREEKICFAP